MPKNPDRRRASPHVIFWCLAVADLFLWVTAFVWRPGDIPPPPVVAINVWPGSESFIAARESGALSGQTINFVEMAWVSPMMRAFGNHSLDAAVLSLSEVALLRDLNTPLRIMLAIDESTGADALLVRPDLGEIHTPAGLRGRKVGVEIRSAGHYLLTRALFDGGLTLNDVEVVPINLPESETAFEEFKLDAVATSEPWVTRLLAKGSRVVYDSSQAPGEFQRVLAVREETAGRETRSLKKMVAAHFELLEQQWQNWDPRLAAGMGRREGLTASELGLAMSRLKFHSRREQARLIGGERPALRDDFEKVAGILWAAGLMQNAAPPEALFDDALISP